MTNLPTWPAFDSAKPHPFFINAAVLYNLWLAKGVSVPFAIAMVTNAEYESCFEPQAVGDNGTAFNLYQWHWQPRGANILGRTGIDVRSERSFSKIVDAAWWEMNGPMIKARNAIAGETTAADASHAACVLYEGAGAPNAAERRAEGAERWSAFFAAHADFVAAHKAVK